MAERIIRFELRHEYQEDDELNCAVKVWSIYKIVRDRSYTTTRMYSSANRLFVLGVKEFLEKDLDGPWFRVPEGE